MDPGLEILIHPMKAAAGKPKCFIEYKAIKHPVLPSPALQCMAKAPGSFSAISKNYYAILGGGAVPSKKYRSTCLIFFLRNLSRSYCSLFRRTTIVTPSFLKIGA